VAKSNSDPLRARLEQLVTEMRLDVAQARTYSTAQNINCVYPVGTVEAWLVRLEAVLREPPVAPAPPGEWPFDHAPHCNVWVETPESYHMDRERPCTCAVARAAAPKASDAAQVE
jgi:hypothetical protein